MSRCPTPHTNMSILKQNIRLKSQETAQRKQKMETEGDGCDVSILSKTIQLSPLDDNIGDKSFPLVFQCVKCAHIIGDSVSWVCSNEDLRAVTLMRVSENVKQGTQMKTSTDVFDVGSAYIPLSCRRCSVDLGRLYRTTPRHLDELRDMYTIDVDRLEFYQVGSSHQQAASTDVTENLLTTKELKLCLDEQKKRIVALEEKLWQLQTTRHTEFQHLNGNSDSEHH